MRLRRGVTQQMFLFGVLAAIVVGAGAVAGVMMASGAFSTTDDADTKTTVQKLQQASEPTESTLVINAERQKDTSTSTVTDVNATVYVGSQDSPYGSSIKSSSSFDIGDGETVTVGTDSLVSVQEYDNSYYSHGQEATYTDGQRTTNPMVPVEGLTINNKRPVLNYEVWQTASVSDLVTKVYDNRGSELTTGSNTNHEDYELSLSSDDAKEVEIELEQDGSDKRADVCGFAVKTLNDIDGETVNKVETPDGDTIEGDDIETEEVPEHLQTNIVMNESVDLSENVTDYDNVYRLPQTVHMEHNDKMSAFVDVESDQDNDPAAVDSGDLTTTDAFIFEWKDCDYFENTDGVNQYDLHKDDSSESDLGILEPDYSPLGGEQGIIIEGT